MQLDPKDPLEIVIVTFDFTKLTSTVTSAAFSVVVQDGSDANPSALLQGSTTISGAKVLQKIAGGLSGVTYKIYCLVDTAEGERIREEAFMKVVAE